METSESEENTLTTLLFQTANVKRGSVVTAIPLIVQDGSLVKQYKGASGIYEVCWNRDGSKLATSFSDNTVSGLSTSTQKILFQIAGLSNSLSVAIQQV